MRRLLTASRRGRGPSSGSCELGYASPELPKSSSRIAFAFDQPSAGISNDGFSSTICCRSEKNERRLYSVIGASPG